MNPTLHLETGSLEQASHFLPGRRALVLILAAFGLAVRRFGRLDANEHRVEPGLYHEIEQIRIVGQVMDTSC